MPFEPCESSDLEIFKGISSGKIHCVPRVLEQGISICIGELYLPSENSFVILLNASAAGGPD